MPKIVTALFLACIVASSAALADTTVNFMDRLPTEEELTKALAAPEVEKRPRTRGIQLQRTDAENPDKNGTAASPSRVILDIKFEYDSCRLTEKAKTTLETLGRAMNSERLANATFLVEGHCDATGPEDYNLRLSRERAEAAARYLETVCKVDGKRLSVKGMGETRLLDKQHPESGGNRRVEVVNMTR